MKWYDLWLKILGDIIANFQYLEPTDKENLEAQKYLSRELEGLVPL